MLFDPGLGLLQHGVGQIHADDPARVTNGLLQIFEVKPYAATDLHHTVTRFEIERGDGLLAIMRFAKTEQVIEVGRKIIGTGTLAVQIPDAVLAEGHAMDSSG